MAVFKGYTPFVVTTKYWLCALLCSAPLWLILCRVVSAPPPGFCPHQLVSHQAAPSFGTSLRPALWPGARGGSPICPQRPGCAFSPASPPGPSPPLSPGLEAAAPALPGRLQPPCPAGRLAVPGCASSVCLHVLRASPFSRAAPWKVRVWGACVAWPLKVSLRSRVLASRLPSERRDVVGWVHPLLNPRTRAGRGRDPADAGAGGGRARAGGAGAAALELPAAGLRLLCSLFRVTSHVEPSFLPPKGTRGVQEKPRTSVTGKKGPSESCSALVFIFWCPSF